MRPLFSSLIRGNPFYHAVRMSRVLSRTQLREIAGTHPALVQSPAPEDGPRLARLLVDAGVLTPFQVAEIEAGRGEQLRLGQYRLLDLIATGGMGQVFRAEHVLMQRIVALKVLARRRIEPGGARTHWPAAVIREIRAAAQLAHPHVITAHDADQDRERLFLVMEYLEGMDFGRLIPQVGPLPVVLACDYIRQAALGLAAAHARGLIHRDIKPANLLVSGHCLPASWPPQTRGIVKILDLGLACLAQMDPSPAGEGHLAGTPDYMAPELARDCHVLDPRADLYSLGCTWYYLLTGQAPYPGSTWTEKLLAHELNPLPSVRTVRPDVPEDVAAMLARLMARAPQERFATATELAQTLEAWLATHAWNYLPATPGEMALPLASPATPTATALADPTAPRPQGALPVRRQGWRLGMRGIGLAIGAGLLLAVVTQQIAQRFREAIQTIDRSEINASPTVLSSSPPARLPVWIELRGERHPTLAAAIAAAHDGEVITVGGTETLLSPPLSWSGKALLFRAAPGSSPTLLLTATASSQYWQALFTTDSALTLEGLHLGLALPPDAAPRSTAHLICCKGSRLLIERCQLDAPQTTALVVARGCAHVELTRCSVRGKATAVSVEVGRGGPCRVSMTESHLRLTGDGAAAFSLWAPEIRRPDPVHLSLIRNRIESGRLAAFTALPGALALTVRDNDLQVREALFSFAAFPGVEGWCRGLTWQGENNRSQGPHTRILIDGQPQHTTRFQSR